MLRDPNSPYFPVGLLDDDPDKRNLQIMGVRVLGDRTQLAKAAEDTGAEALLIAIPSADATLISDLNEHAGQLDLAVKVLPAVRDLFGGGPSLADIRDINIADLLGRHQIETNVDEIAGYVTGKRVLVTGAGGSIGSELCRQLHQFGPSELLMLDRDESALHSVQLSIDGRALLESPNLLLADIRDIEQINRIFEEHRPQVVFHAAALKHLTLLERNPGEAVKSNVWGTLTILDASRAHGVERFVNISTDKAADPCSVLGYSKRIAERLTAHVAQGADGVYLSVRFGNVLGSRGSVLTTFKEQVADGGPLTVTHPDVTRYFMTVQEAVQLVIQAGAIGNDGEALVLDMGEPVRIADVARQLGDQADRSIRIVYTGLRPGEKLHEHLLGRDEMDVRPMHPLISQVPVPPLEPDDARALDPWNIHDNVIGELGRLSSTGTTPDPDPSFADHDRI
jgi:FlaA1/EpsC-like NDP-sugar epimerase